MHVVHKTKERCCNKRTSCGNEDDKENRKVLTYRPKKEESLSKRNNIPVGGGFEYRDDNHLVIVVDMEVLNTADGDLIQTYCLRQGRAKDMQRVLTYRSKRSDDVLKEEVFKVGRGVEYQALDTA